MEYKRFSDRDTYRRMIREYLEAFLEIFRDEEFRKIFDEIFSELSPIVVRPPVVSVEARPRRTVVRIRVLPVEEAEVAMDLGEELVHLEIVGDRVVLVSRRDVASG